MKINSITIEQRGNLCSLFLPNQSCIAQLILPPDGAYIADMEALKYITKTLAVRCNVYKGNNNSNNNGHKN